VLLGDILATNAANWPQHTAVVAGERRVTFAELERSANRLAAALGALARPGDRVAILATNIPEYVDAFYGVPAAGLVLTLLNYRLNPKEWAYILGDAGVRVLLVEHRFVEQLHPVLSGISSLEHVVVIGAPADDHARSYEELLAAAPADPPAHRPAPDDVACLVYTSGTTGFPKGAVITQANIVFAVTAFGYELELGMHERFLMAFPMCHASGFQVFAFHLRAAEFHLTPMFDPGDWLELVETHRITHSGLAPTMASFVLNHPRWPDADLSSMKVLSYGGMTMPADTARRLVERVPALATGFGQSETTLLVTSGGPELHRRALAGEEHLLASCGRPGLFAAVKVFDDEMRECPRGEVGELCVRGPTAMKEYWGNAEGTRDAFAGGWLHTGDLARQDDEGLVYIVDRKKDMLITGGQNVYPRELEHVLATHPAVQEVAVVGLPDPVWGDNVVAAVVLRPGATVTAAELVALCKANLASYKKPKHVYFVDDLPKNVTGKIQKRELLEHLLACDT